MVAKFALLGIFALIGLVVGGVGLTRVVRREYLRRHGCLTTGTVVAIREATVDASTVFAPVVAFTTHQGNSEVTSTYASPCFYRVGQQVQVCYAPENPERGVILTWEEALKAWGLLAGGFVMLGIGAALGLVM